MKNDGQNGQVHFTEKQLFMSISFNKVAGLQPKKKTPAEMFSCEFA